MQAMLKPDLLSQGWGHQPALPAAQKRCITRKLDAFLKRNAGAPKQDMLLRYLVEIPQDHQVSQLTQAEMSYLFFHGPECPIFYDEELDHWFAYDKRWRGAKSNLTMVRGFFQTEFSHVIMQIITLAKNSRVFPPSGQDDHPRMKFLKDTEKALLKRENTEKIIREASIYFLQQAVFDAEPYIFQLENCVLDLHTNTFRRGIPSDMARMASPITVPETWLVNPGLIETEGAPMRRRAWDIVWSMFSREDKDGVYGPHHPDDAINELGDQDIANFNFCMKLLARMLEGRPLKKCVFPYSLRGRNSKGRPQHKPIDLSGILLSDKKNPNSKRSHALITITLHPPFKAHVPY